MIDNSNNNEVLIFKELPKEQRKALQKEYRGTAEAKTSEKKLVIGGVIFATIAIVIAIISMSMRHAAFTAASPIVLFFCIFPASISQQKFEKWLATEKNIAVKRKR